MPIRAARLAIGMALEQSGIAVHSAHNDELDETFREIPFERSPKGALNNVASRLQKRRPLPVQFIAMAQQGFDTQVAEALDGTSVPATFVRGAQSYISSARDIARGVRLLEGRGITTQSYETYIHQHDRSKAKLALGHFAFLSAAHQFREAEFLRSLSS